MVGSPPVEEILLMMRFAVLLFAMPLAIGQAHAQAQSQDTKPAPHHRMTSQQRFEQANTAHDGHLTLEQAKAGYPSIARHFTEIDSANKGYVTEDDIRAWRKQRRSSRGARPPAESALQPHPAMQWVFPVPRQFNASTTQTVPMPREEVLDVPEVPPRELRS
jgi:hypothetical protein